MLEDLNPAVDTIENATKGRAIGSVGYAKDSPRNPSLNIEAKLLVIGLDPNGVVALLRVEGRVEGREEGVVK